eukprot:gene2295-2605_t
MAPRARLAMYKVSWGAGVDKTTSLVDVVAAFDAAVGDGVHIINLSMGTDVPANSLFNTPLTIASQNAATAGISVVVAAGNAGPRPGTLTDAGEPWVTTVAASTYPRQSETESDVDAPVMYEHSSRGPLPGHPDVLKPDIT